MRAGPDTRVETIRAGRLHGDDGRGLAVPLRVRNALHDPIQQPPATNTTHHSIDLPLRAPLGKLLPQLLHHRRGPRPDKWVVKGRHVDRIPALPDHELLAHDAVSLGPVPPGLVHCDLRAEGEELVLHELGRGRGDADRGGAAEGEGRVCAREAGVAAGGAEEARGRGRAVGHEVADAPRLEAAGGLEVVELEVDVAGGSVYCTFDRVVTYHPAALEI